MRRSPSDRHPTATWVGTPNHWDGCLSRRAVVIHIAQGGFTSSIDWMRKNGTSSHFIVAKTGKIAQLVGINDSAWCNGLSYDDAGQRWICPHGHVVIPRWARLRELALLRDDDENPNRHTISIEHEGYSGNVPPQSQLDATVELLRWLGGQFPELLPWRVGETLIGHCDLDNVDKAGCPGPGFDLATLATRANSLMTPIEQPPGWQRAWTLRGVALPPDQVSWAIPQLYKFHYAQLGACVAAEQYLNPQFSIALFERGYIYYLPKTQRAYLGSALPVEL